MADADSLERPVFGGRRWRRPPNVALVVMIAACALDGCARGTPTVLPDADAHRASTIEHPALAPREGETAVDEHGRAYVVTRVAKTQALRVDAHTVRGMWGIPLDVVREDDDAYYYKRYATVVPAPQPTTVGSDARATPVAASTAGEHVATRTSDRLRFRPFGAGLPTSGQWREGFTLADMNGDGHPDLVHGPARKSFSGPSVFLGDGHGSWRRWSEAHFAPHPYDYGDAQAADVNGDGHADIVLAVHLRGLIALLGDGAGGFTDASDGLDFSGDAGGAGFSSRAIRLTDWDGDGRLDVLALGEGPRLAIGAPGGRAGSSADGVVAYLNRGGRWERRDQANSKGRIFGQAITIGDFDGDRHRDVATGSGILGRTDLVHLGTGDGGSTPVDVPVPAQSYVRAVAARDFDGDGRDDLVVGYVQRVGTSWRTGIDVLYPRAGTSWDRRALFTRAGRAGISALAAGDLDGDGRGDVVALSGEGETLVFAGDGHGFFTHEMAHIPPFAGGCRGSHVELADVDGDGRDDVIASFAEERSSVAASDACPSGGGLTVWKVQ
jgi:hypothetical protein